MARAPAAALGIIIAIREGLTTRGPFSRNLRCSSSYRAMPPMPEPTTMPTRAGSTSLGSSLACSRASLAAANASCEKRWRRRALRASRNWPMSKSGICAPILEGRADVSKPERGRPPERPSTRPFQNSSSPVPMGVTGPIPVMTTRRRRPSLRSGRDGPPRSGGSGIRGNLLAQQVHGVAHRRHLLELVVGDLDPEPLLHGHDGRHEVDGVEAELVVQARRHL